MIIVSENITSKLPGETSLYIQFDYNADIINIIKQNCPVMNYDKSTKIWEVPVTSLRNLIDALCQIDDITLNVLPTIKEKKINNIKLDQFKTKPYQYQIDGIKYGLSHNKFLLLDAPGLGKTLQICYIAQELKRTKNLQHCLIVCGVNTLKYNWKNEILKHTDLSCMILGERLKKNGRTYIGSIEDRLHDLKNPIKEFFIITNIQTLRDNDIIKQLNSKSAINKIDMICCDEVQACKNPSSQQGKHFLKLNSKYKIAATGTLIMNNPLDAYVGLKWIDADRSTYSNFKYYYCNYGGPFNNILLGFKNITILKDQIEKYSLRRTKDLLDLPDKTIIHELIEMEDTQQLFYDNLCNGMLDQVDLVHIDSNTVLSMVTRLRQATACPSVLTSSNVSSAKIDRAIDLAEQIVNNENKVVIFSMFKETVRVLSESLKQYNPLVCTGDNKDDEIADSIDSFQKDPKCKIMICTVQKMGTGITLTAASYAIFIDCAYTAAQNLQCEDRIYRIGSKEPVFIYYLWTKGTIDERVKQIVEDKEAMSDYLIDDKITQKSIVSLQKYLQEIQK